MRYLCISTIILDIIISEHDGSSELIEAQKIYNLPNRVDSVFSERTRNIQGNHSV